MRYISGFFILFLLFSFFSLNYARKDPEDYWKTIMTGEPMPKAIKDFFQQDPASHANKKIEKLGDTHSDHTLNMDHFVKDFGTRPNLIIYHSHVDTQVVEQFTKDVKSDIALSRKRNPKHVKPELNVPEV